MQANLIIQGPRTSVLWFVFLMSFARPTFGGDPLSAAQMRITLNELSLVEALQLSPNFLNTVLEVGSDAARESQAKFALFEGLNKLREGDSEAAIARLTVAIEANRMDPAGYWLRARAFAKDDQPARAKEDCRHALDIDGEFTPAQLTLAAVTLDTEGPEEALLMIDQECSPKGDHGDVSYENYVKALAFLRKREPQLAVKHFEIALHASYTYLPLPTGELFFQKASAHEQAGEVEKALCSVRRSVEVDGKQPQSLFFLWRLHRKLGNHLAAFYTAKRLSAIGDENEKVKWRLVILQSLMDLQQYRASVEDATEILSIDSENVTAQRALDHLHAAKKKAQAGLR